MNYNSMIKEKETVMNHEGAKAYAMTPEMELYTAVVTCALSDKFYESMPSLTNVLLSSKTSLIPAGIGNAPPSE